MALLLTSEDVDDLATDEVALEAMRTGFRAEGEGETHLPNRLDADSPTGFFRVMPAVLDGVMGCKIMTLVRDRGTRYLVLLYAVDTGECLAMIDADLLTKTRTAATTALGGLHMVPDAPTKLAVVGTGFEARGHLAFLAGIWPLKTTVAYSRSEENRRSFADDMSAELGIEVTASASVDDTVASADIVLLATKASEPVLDGARLQPGAVVLSIGSTRPDLRELDRTTLARAEVLVVDALNQVLDESGDLIDALEHGAIDADRALPLAELVADDRVLRRADSDGDRDVNVFKSAGTALQDLALARALYERARDEGRGRDVGEVSRLKPFT